MKWPGAGGMILSTGGKFWLRRSVPILALIQAAEVYLWSDGVWEYGSNLKLKNFG
jgi:hypothetical protein